MYETPGRIRVIVDMRKGNCYFVAPEPVGLVTPTAVAHVELAPDEVMVTGKAELDSYFYRCQVPEEY